MNLAKLFGKKQKPKNNYPTQNYVTIKAKVNIETKVNEIFSTTKVTQKLRNHTNNPIELEIYIDKYLDNIIFSSFHVKIGNSMEASSKVIKKEKAEEKYTDSISSGNAAIYTAIDKNDENKIIVHIGNIPANEELIFISEFIQFTESTNNCYEHELFRNLPILKGKSGIGFENEIINGNIEIKTKNKITKIDKDISLNLLIIKEEKEDKKGNLYFLEYKYNNYSSLYIPSSKIHFSLDSNSNQVLFSQNCIKNKNEQSYILNYKLTENKKEITNKKKKQENIKLSPALFIFLIDQSGSMSGSPIKVASKALLLFLQSLPAGSYYQIIGFGSNYKVYDNIPKEYNQNNILESIKIVESLKGDMGGTDIYAPLKYIYESSKKYNKILLPRNIFLLTDGEIDNKDDTLKLIEKNSSEYSIYSFGIGNDFDKDLIKNAGIIGKGNYAFCRKIEGLNQVIASTLNNICVSYINDFKIISSLDKFNLYKKNEIIPVIKENKVYRFSYIAKEELDLKKMDFTVEYKKNKEKYSQNYELEPNELPTGDELSKLIIYEYISKMNNLSEEEKIKLALKYQLFIEGTSLFAEVELSEKSTEKIIEHKEVIIDSSKEDIKEYNQNLEQAVLDKKINDMELRLMNMETEVNDIRNEIKAKLKSGDKAGAKRLATKQVQITENMKQLEGCMAMMEEQKMMLDNTLQMRDVMSAIKSANCSIKSACNSLMVEDLEAMKDNMEDVKPDQEELNDFFKDYSGECENDEVNCILEQIGEEINEEAEAIPNMGLNKEQIKQKDQSLKDEEDLLKDFLYIDDDPKPIEKKEVKKEEKKEIKKEEKKEYNKKKKK